MTKVNFGSIVNLSTVDWHSKVSMVIFLRRCPLRCVYCQNYNLLEENNYVEIEEVRKEIEKEEDFIDAVVLSGGEPFMQPQAVEDISRFAKNRNLEVGVQTNGFYPMRMEYALKENLIDKIFLDIKAPLSDEMLYRRLTGISEASLRTEGSDIVERVKKTLNICATLNANFEVVTTVFRNLVATEEVKKIAKELSEMGIISYVIQQGRPELAPLHSKDIRKETAFSRDELKEMAKLSGLKEVRIRTKEYGEEKLCFEA